MKIEVIDKSKQKPVENYSVLDLSIFDFQGWKTLNENEIVIDLDQLADVIINEIVIDLDQLADVIISLDSNDPETNDPTSSEREVDFYLPDPIKNRTLSQFAESGTSTKDPLEPILKSSTILSAVVTEILQNHHPHSDYKVSISDG